MKRKKNASNYLEIWKGLPREIVHEILEKAFSNAMESLDYHGLYPFESVHCEMSKLRLVNKQCNLSFYDLARVVHPRPRYARAALIMQCIMNTLYLNSPYHDVKYGVKRAMGLDAIPSFYGNTRVIFYYLYSTVYILTTCRKTRKKIKSFRDEKIAMFHWLCDNFTRVALQGHPSTRRLLTVRHRVLETTCF